MTQNDSKFRQVNASLGTSPKIGPFPADQVVPWTVIFLTTYYLGKVILGWTWIWTLILAAWGMATWWVLTGSKSWMYLSKFVRTPKWTRGFGSYVSVVNTVNTNLESTSSQQRGCMNSHKTRRNCRF